MRSRFLVVRLPDVSFLKEMRLFTRAVFVAALLAMRLAPMSAQQNASLCPEHPRLVLFVVVDNLNEQQMEIVRNQCGPKGFNRIYGQGARLTDAYYDAGGGFAGKNLATLFTGAPAASHGIVGRRWIDSFTGRKVDAIYGEVPPSGRFDTLAVPQTGALLCGTIANQVRKIYNDKAKVFSVGFDPQMLIWASGGGSLGEPFVWLDGRSGMVRMVNVADTATRRWVADFNDKKIPALYRSKTWAPRKDITEYHQSRFFPQAASSPFFHPLDRPSDPALRFSAVCGSPYGNDLVRDIAAAAIAYEGLGQDDVPDVLTVQFTAMPALGSKRQPLDPETEDMLLGLDDNVASLLQFIDSTVGMNNTLVVFTAASGSLDVAATSSPTWSHRGCVSLAKASALLNLYLMAIHGQARWVKNHAPGAIYLDAELAAKRKVNFDTLLEQSAQFLLQVKGIGGAYPARSLPSIAAASPVVEAMRRNYHPKRSGDILVHLEPGWAEELDDGSRQAQLWGGEFVPLVFYGWKVQRSTIYERHSMTDVAPTICSFIGVAQPDASSGTPIRMDIGAD